MKVLAGKSTTRILAWALFFAAVVLSIVPPQYRPVSGLPSWVEHGVFFTIAGWVFALAYPRSGLTLCAFGILFAALLEAVQLYMPGRHARLGDFLIDAIAMLIGILLSRLLDRMRLRKSTSS